MPKTNKTIIKKDLKTSKFTTVHHSMLYDKRLSPNALRVLISLLADADDFNASYKLFENRFGISNKTVRAAFKNLEECGYVKLTKLKRGHYYTISEYGNLNTEANNDSTTEVQSSTEENKFQKQIDKNNTLLQDYLLSISSFLEYDVIHDTVIDNVSSHTDTSGVLDFYAFKNQTEKLLKDIKGNRYKSLMEFTNKRSSVISKKADKSYKEWLKEELYTNNRIPTDAECKKKWTYIKARNQVFKTDFETAAHDRAEEEYYDNQ